MRSLTRRACALALLAGLVLLLTGCGDDPRTVTVSANAGAAILEPGDHLRVDLGAQDRETGGDWFLVRDPDPAILTDTGMDFHSECPGGGAPCRGRTFWGFTATGTGFTSLTFQRCLGGTTPPACDFDTAPVTLSVRVRVGSD